MTATNRVELNFEQVSAILRVCFETGVTEIAYGPLKASFGARTSPPAAAAPQASPPAVPVPPEVTAEEERQAIASVEADIKADLVAELAASDPALYEALIASGDLVDGENILGPDETLSRG